MDLVMPIALGVISLATGIGLIIYGFRGVRHSQARNSRTFKKGRI